MGLRTSAQGAPHQRSVVIGGRLFPQAAFIMVLAAGDESTIRNK
jgi:hypothetical protein